MVPLRRRSKGWQRSGAIAPAIEAAVGDAGEGVGAAREHQVGPALAQEVEAVGDRVVAGGAGGRDRHRRSLEPDVVGHEGGQEMARVLARELGPDPLEASGHVAIVEALDLARFSRGRADHDARPRRLPHGGRAGVGHREPGRGHRELGHPPEPGEVVGGPEVLDLPAAVNGVTAGVERVHGRDPRPAREEVGPQLAPSRP
jgi:hypothetical protein